MFKDGELFPAKTYKLFTVETLRRVVLWRLRRQLVAAGAVQPKPSVKLCLAAGKIAGGTDREAMLAHFGRHRWQLFDQVWIREQLMSMKDKPYENDVAFMVAKLLLRTPK